MTTKVKRIIPLLLCVAILLSLSACKSAKKDIDLGGVDIIEKINTLKTSEESLGLYEKYKTLTEIEGGEIDPELVGKWAMADKSVSFEFTEDGKQKAVSDDYGEHELTYTCIKIDGFNIICTETTITRVDTDGNETKSPIVTYTAYLVENDALYMASVESPPNEYVTSSQFMLISMYRYDDKEKFDSIVKENHYSIKTLNGKWSTDKGSTVIKDGVLTLDDNDYYVYFDNNNDLVCEGKDSTTTYSFAVTILKNYDIDDKSKFEEKLVFAINYTGKDKNDTPNLLPLLDDWKKDFDYETYYYTAYLEKN